MDTLRRRIPFKVAEDDQEATEHEILDEQQQDQVIERLRRENEIANYRYSIALKLVVGLSCLLHILTFNYNPLFTIFPTQAAAASIPFPTAFTILALYVHLNLTFTFFSTEIQTRFLLPEQIKPHSFRLLYFLSAVAPTLCLFLAKPWQTIIWWCSTPLIVFIAQTVTDAIEQNNQGIANLETLRYAAPGA